MKMSTQKQPHEAVSESICITASSLFCTYGDHPVGLFGGVGTHLNTSKEHPFLALSLKYPEPNTEPILIASMVEIDDEIETPHERICILAEDALRQLLETRREPDSADKQLIVLLVPEADSLRGNNLDRARFEERLRQCHPHVRNCEIRMIEKSRGAVAQLQNIRAGLQQHTWDRIIYGGVDSLVDIATCSELIRQEKVMTRTYDRGIIPGEAAAFVQLQRYSDTNDGILIGALDSQDEPNNGKALDTPMKGLSQVTLNCLNFVEITGDKIKTIIQPFNAGEADSVEWYQVKENVWPRAELNFAEELTPQLFMGYIGAAAFPLSLILGCARFDFRFPSVSDILVCEADGMRRGAVILQDKRGIDTQFLDANYRSNCVQQGNNYPMSRR